MKWDKNKIKEFRKGLDFSQADFAELLGTSQRLISDWEKGKKKPCGTSQKALSLVAGVVDVEREIEKIKSKKPKGKESRISPDTIRDFREKLSLSQTEFAEKLGRDLSTISYWESGKRHPGEESQRRMKVLAKEEGIELPFDAQAGKIPESEDS